MRISDWSSDVCSSDLAQGLAYDVQSMDATFARLYPEQYAATISGDRMAQDARERWKNTLDGLHTAMRMQAQVSQNLAQDESALADLVSQSQSATGALQAQQARSEEHTSELQSLMRISYAVFCLNKKQIHNKHPRL